MNNQQLFSILGKLSGHLVTGSPQHESEIQRLHQALSRVLLPTDIQQLKSSHFTFENADLFLLEQISSERSAPLQDIVEQRTATHAEPEFRVFVREVPVRGSLLHGSIPQWANTAFYAPHPRRRRHRSADRVYHNPLNYPLYPVHPVCSFFSFWLYTDRTI